MVYATIIKPILDKIAGIICLVLFSPIFLTVTLFLLIEKEGSIFFRQQRVTGNGKYFTIYKFRSMNNKRDASGQLLSDAQRLTKLGKFLRKTSLDEIPQLINVLRGDMSLVGPRPLPPAYLKLYSTFQNRRHEVLGGITGWAQVNGRNAISWEEKFELDVWYVDHQSFLLDVKILLRTIKKVLLRDGINTKGTSTTQPFKG